MRLGGWWRLWIGLSALWAAGALSFALFAVERPTPASVAESVGSTCDLEMPVPSELAGRVLKVPAQLAKIKELNGEANAAARKQISEAVRATVNALAAHAGKVADYRVYTVSDPQGKLYELVAPSHSTDAQIYEQLSTEQLGQYQPNSWAKFQDYCVAKLNSQHRNELYPAERREWIRGTVIGTLSFPLLSLLFGAFIGWVWRGFRHRKT